MAAHEARHGHDRGDERRSGRGDRDGRDRRVVRVGHDGRDGVDLVHRFVVGVDVDAVVIDDRERFGLVLRGGVVVGFDLDRLIVDGRCLIGIGFGRVRIVVQHRFLERDDDRIRFVLVRYRFGFGLLVALRRLRRHLERVVMRAAHTWSLWSTTAVLVVDVPSASVARGDLDPAVILDDALVIADRELAAIDETVSRFRGDSELNRLHRSLPDGVEVSPLLAAFVSAGIEAARLTDGAVDLTLGRRLAHLGYDRDIELVLDDDRPIRAIATDVSGWERVQLRGRRLRVPADRTIDLGATAKALAADRVAESIAVQLGCSVLLSLGGDISTAGGEPEGGWSVLVEDLPGEPHTTVRVTAGHAVATSSILRRRWRRGEETFHHILDPRTGLPADPVWRSATVAAETCVRANTYATAAIVLGAAAPAWLAGRAAARLVDAEGRVLTIGGWPEEHTTAEKEAAHG